MTGVRTGELQEAIYGGVPITTLGDIFGLDPKETNKRIAGRVQPVAGSGKLLKYRIREAAPYLVQSQIDPEDFIKSLSPSKLPPALQDAFWKAQLSRQKFQEIRGELWNTTRVFEVVSSAFKVIRLTILMFVDTVEQRTQLSPEQRRIVQELGDGLLQSLEKSLRDEFAFYSPEDDEHGTPLTAKILIVEEPEEEVDPFA